MSDILIMALTVTTSVSVEGRNDILLMLLIITTAVSVVVTGYLISKWKGKQ